MDTFTPAVAAAEFASHWQRPLIMATQPLSRETRGPMMHVALRAVVGNLEPGSSGPQRPCLSTGCDAFLQATCFPHLPDPRAGRRHPPQAGSSPAVRVRWSHHSRGPGATTGSVLPSGRGVPDFHTQLLGQKLHPVKFSLLERPVFLSPGS